MVDDLGMLLLSEVVPLEHKAEDGDEGSIGLATANRWGCGDGTNAKEVAGMSKRRSERR